LCPLIAVHPSAGCALPTAAVAGLRA